MFYDVFLNKQMMVIHPDVNSRYCLMVVQLKHERPNQSQPIENL